MKIFSILLMALLLTGCERSEPKDKTGKVKETRVNGYKGAANYNPYLGAQRFLIDSPSVHNSVNVRSGYISLSDREAVVVANASSLQDENHVARIMRWVSQGGQYVCIIERGERNWQDVGEYADHDPYEWDRETSATSEKALAKFLDRNNISLIDDPSGIGLETEYDDSGVEKKIALGKYIPSAEDVKINLFGEEFKARLGGTRVLKNDSYYGTGTYTDEGEEYHRFISKTYGQGRVYFITDGRVFRNPYLKLNDHAALLETIATGGDYNQAGDIIFSFGGEPTFWPMLNKFAWPALLGLIVLVALWLWKGMPRFGPLLEVEDSHARDYSQSVSNTGNFLWKHKRLDALLTPLRNEVYRKSGMFDAEGKVDESLVETLSETSGVPEDHVLEALSRAGETDPASMVRITKNLQTILKSL